MAKKRFRLLLPGLFMVLFLNCKAAMTTYDWLPTECAPKAFPVEIVSGDFLFENGRALYIPDRQLVSNGWGNFGSTHIVGDALKPLPSGLRITWLSFAEDRFYTGTFPLPKDKLEQYFTEGYTSPLTGEHKIYDQIVVGMAPGGGVAVWVKGEQVTREVCFLTAHDTAIDWATFIDNPDYPRRRYVQEMLAQARDSAGPAVPAQLPVPPLALWRDTYRQLRSWQPVVVGKSGATGIAVDFYNGEQAFLAGENKAFAGPKPAPRNLVVRWKGAAGGAWGAEVNFDEAEIFAALQRMDPAAGSSPLKLQLQISETGPSVQVLLSNAREVLQLRRCAVRVFPD